MQHSLLEVGERGLVARRVEFASSRRTTPSSRSGTIFQVSKDDRPGTRHEEIDSRWKLEENGTRRERG